MEANMTTTKPATLPYCPCGECGLDPARWTPECKAERLEADGDLGLYVTANGETWETTVHDFLGDNAGDADVAEGVLRAVAAPGVEVTLGGGAVPSVILVAVAP